MVNSSPELMTLKLLLRYALYHMNNQPLTYAAFFVFVRRGAGLQASAGAPEGRGL